MPGATFQLSVGRHVKRQPGLQEGDSRECLDQALHQDPPFADDKSIESTVDLQPPRHRWTEEYTSYTGGRRSGGGLASQSGCLAKNTEAGTLLAPP